MSLLYEKELIPRAKELRKNATRQENHLWYDFLRTHPIRFQRQKTIGGFIVDFYCHKATLAIELDGSQHYSVSGLAYDEERDKILSGYGIYVMRFPNSEIDRHFEEVCAVINQQVQKRTGMTP